MEILQKFKSALFYGKALKNFEKGKYKFSASLLEKIVDLKLPEGLRKEVIQFYLSISYLEIGKNKKALYNLSDAYDVFKNKIKEKNDMDDIYYFKILSEKYISLLQLYDNSELSIKVKNDLNKLVTIQRKSEKSRKKT